MKKNQAKTNVEKRAEKDAFESIIQGVVSLGYSRDVVEPLFMEKWKEGLDIENVNKAINCIRSAIDERDNPKTQEMESCNKEPEEKKEPSIDKEAQRKGVIEKLYKVVSIPSAVDVLNGLRKWITIVSPCDVPIDSDN